MPKKNRQIGSPTRGMNNFADPRDIPSGHFSNLECANIEIPGVTGLLGQFLPGPALNKNQTDALGDHDKFPDKFPEGDGGLGSKFGIPRTIISIPVQTSGSSTPTLEVLGTDKWNPFVGEMLPLGWEDVTDTTEYADSFQHHITNKDQCGWNPWSADTADTEWNTKVGAATSDMPLGKSNVQLKTAEQACDSQWLIETKTNCFQFGMVGAFVYNCGANQTDYDQAGYQTNMSKVMHVLGPRKAILSNKIQGAADDWIIIKWAPNYGEIKGDCKYNICIQSIDTDIQSVGFKVDYNTEGTDYTPDKAYWFTHPDNHWQIPMLCQEYQSNKKVSSTWYDHYKQDLADVRTRGIKLIGNAVSGRTNNHSSHGADFSANKYSDWYRIDYGIYIRWKNGSSGNFDDNISVGDKWTFNVRSPMTLNNFDSAYDRTYRDLGGNLHRSSYGNKYIQGHKSDLFGNSSIVEFSGSYLLGSSKGGDNYKQLAMESHGSVYTWNNYHLSNVDDPDYEHGWFHLGKCIYENEKTILKQHGDQVDDTGRMWTTNTSRWPEDSSINPIPSYLAHKKGKHYRINPMSIRFWRITKEGNRQLMPHSFGGNPVRNAYNGSTGKPWDNLSDWNIGDAGYHDFSTQGGDHDAAQYGEYGMFSDGSVGNNSQIDVGDGHVGIDIDAYGATDSYYSVADGDRTLAKGEGLEMTYDTEITYDGNYYPTDITYLNGKLRVANPNWAFNSKTWWRGYNRGMRPYVWEDWCALPGWVMANEPHPDTSGRRESELGLAESWSSTGTYNNSPFGWKSKPVSYYSSWELMSRPIELEAPKTIASMPDEWWGPVIVTYGHATSQANSSKNYPFIQSAWGRATMDSDDDDTAGRETTSMVRDVHGIGHDGHTALPVSCLLKDKDDDEGIDDHGHEHDYMKRVWDRCKQAMVFMRYNSPLHGAVNKAYKDGSPYVMVMVETYVDNGTDGWGGAVETAIGQRGAQDVGFGFQAGGNTNLTQAGGGSASSMLHSGGHNDDWPMSDVCHSTSTTDGTAYDIAHVDGNGSSNSEGNLVSHMVRIREMLTVQGDWTTGAGEGATVLYGTSTLPYFGTYASTGNFDSWAVDEGDTSDTGSNQFNMTDWSTELGYTIIIPYLEDMYENSTGKCLFNEGRVYAYRIFPPQGGIIIKHHGRGADTTAEQWKGHAMAQHTGIEGVADRTDEKLAPTVFWKPDVTYTFGASFVDRDENESEIMDSGYSNITLDKYEQFRPGISLRGPYPGWVDKIRIYIKVSGGSDDAWSLFMESDFRSCYFYKESDMKTNQTLYTIPNEIRHQGEKLYNKCGYLDEGTIHSGFDTANNTSQFNSELAFTLDGHKISRMNAITYRLLNGFKPATTDSERIVGWETSALVNGILVVGAIRLASGTYYSDKLIWSPKFKKPRYDNLHFSSAIDLDTQDGDEIIQLVDYGNYLLVFKKNKVIVVSFTNLQQVGVVATFDNNGIYTKEAATKTESGVIWCNENGMYSYGKDGLKNITKGKISDRWWRDLAECNLDNNLYKTRVYPHFTTFYDSTTKCVHAVNGGGVLNAGGKYMITYNTQLNSFTFVRSAFHHQAYWGGQSKIELSANGPATAGHAGRRDGYLMTNINTLRRLQSRVFFGYPGDMMQYWDKDFFYIGKPIKSKFRGNEDMKVLTDMPYLAFHYPNMVSTGGHETSSSGVLNVAQKTGSDDYTAADTILYTDLRSDYTSNLCIGDFIVIRDKDAIHDPMADMKTNGVEEIMQVLNMENIATTQGASAVDKVTVRRGALKTTATAFTRTDDYRIIRLQSDLRTGVFFNYNTSNYRKIGHANVEWETPDMHMTAADVAADTGSNLRSEATRKRFYKLIVTYKNGNIKETDGTTDSRMRCYFAVDGKAFVYDADHEMVTAKAEPTIGASAFKVAAEDWYTQELVPKNKVLCKNNYSIRFRFVSLEQSHYKTADSFGVSRKLYMEQIGDGDEGDIVRCGNWCDEAVSNSPILTHSGSELLDSAGSPLSTWNTGVASSTAALYGPYSIDYPDERVNNYTLIMFNDSSGSKNYISQKLHDNTPSATSGEANIKMIRGCTYRIEVHFIRDENNQIVGDNTYGNDIYPDVGSTTTNTRLHPQASASSQSNYDKVRGKSIPLEVQITETSSTSTVTGDDTSRWILTETGTHVMYYTAPKGVTYDELWLHLINHKSGSSYTYAYTVCTKISIRKVQNLPAGEFEINDMNLIFREKTIK